MRLGHGFFLLQERAFLLHETPGYSVLLVYQMVHYPYVWW